MTPLNHHHDDSYLKAHTASLDVELKAAFSKDGAPGHPTSRRLQRVVARALVRLGVTMLPDSADIVDDRIIILKEPTSESTVPRTDLTRAA